MNRDNQIQCSTSGYPILCPVCGKALTPETNDEPCPDTPYCHGRHEPAAVVLPWDEEDEQLLAESMRDMNGTADSL